MSCNQSRPLTSIDQARMLPWLALLSKRMHTMLQLSGRVSRTSEREPESPWRPQRDCRICTLTLKGDRTPVLDVVNARKLMRVASTGMLAFRERPVHRCWRDIGGLGDDATPLGPNRPGFLHDSDPVSVASQWRVVATVVRFVSIGCDEANIWRTCWRGWKC